MSLNRVKKMTRGRTMRRNRPVERTQIKRQVPKMQLPIKTRRHQILDEGTYKMMLLPVMNRVKNLRTPIQLMI